MPRSLSVSDLVLANSLSPIIRLERIANERRDRVGFSGSGYLVDGPEETFVDGHLNVFTAVDIQCG